MFTAIFYHYSILILDSFEKRMNLFGIDIVAGKIGQRITLLLHNRKPSISIGHLYSKFKRRLVIFIPRLVLCILLLLNVYLVRLSLVSAENGLAGVQSIRKVNIPIEGTGDVMRFSVIAAMLVFLIAFISWLNYRLLSRWFDFYKDRLVGNAFRLITVITTLTIGFGLLRRPPYTIIEMEVYRILGYGTLVWLIGQL